MVGVGISEEEARALSDMYWAEEAEMKAGIHPSQIRERIEICLADNRIAYDEITFLDWDIEGPRVKVQIDDELYGVFNYSTNQFEEVP